MSCQLLEERKDLLILLDRGKVEVVPKSPYTLLKHKFFGGVTIRNLIYPVLQVRQFILYPVCVLFFTLLVGLYPAAYAARMSVTGAMKRTL